MVNPADYERIKELSCWFERRVLTFRRPAITSRDVLSERLIWLVYLSDPKNPAQVGVGECAPLFGLSPETPESAARAASELTLHPERILDTGFAALHPSFVMGVETALCSLQHSHPGIITSAFERAPTCSIPVNGLVWMNNLEAMRREAFERIGEGYTCIKLKIGGLRFEDELSLLQEIRNGYPLSSLEIRVDANGAFSPEEAYGKLEELGALDIHSIEQPVKAGQWNIMSDLCRHPNVAVALDEELIGVTSRDDRCALLDKIRPQYLVLKPTLHGGFNSCEEWIRLATERAIGWWVTSSLESNIGLNAIAQWVSSFNPSIPQGLGTGALFESNTPSLWRKSDGRLYYSAPVAGLEWTKTHPAS